MKSTKIPPSADAVRKQLGWTLKQIHDVVGIHTFFNIGYQNRHLQRLARIAPYFKMYRSNPDWYL